MKKPKTVVDAEAVASAKKAELDAARAAVNRLEKEWFQALAAVKAAQTEADALLPQCRLLRVRWRSEAREDIGRVVILRRTPGGTLVVRPVGEPDGHQFKFKWAEYSRKFRQAERGGYTADILELGDVPAEYQPGAQTT